MTHKQNEIDLGIIILLLKQIWEKSYKLYDGAVKQDEADLICNSDDNPINCDSGVQDY